MRPRIEDGSRPSIPSPPAGQFAARDPTLGAIFHSGCGFGCACQHTSAVFVGLVGDCRVTMSLCLTGQR
jgi:hypothetical protein